MWSCTQICEFSLTIERNGCILRQILNQFYFIWFSLFFHEFNSFCSWKCEFFQTCAFLDDLLHLFFDVIQIFSGEWCMVKIIIKSVFDRWSDRQLGFREKILHCFCQYMGCGMAKCCQTCRIFCSQNIQFTIFVNYSS